jgi:DNA-binding MarR family transcriptional regulator
MTAIGLTAIGPQAGPPDGPDPADRAWEAMRALVHDNERRREVSEALGMSISKIKALSRLAERPMTCKELAAELLTDAPRASVLIDELVQRGLAERTVHPADRRSRIVEVTALGAAEAGRARSILLRAPEPLRALPPDELAALDRILRLLAAS